MKHIPFCPTAPVAQIQTYGMYVYQVSHREISDLGPLLSFPHYKSLFMENIWSVDINTWSDISDE